MKSQEILDKQKQYLWPNHILYYTEPLPLERGDGIYVWDTEGRRYLDFFGGILTTSVGHNRPEIVEKVSAQVGKLIHSSTLYPNENHVRLAEKMAEITPGRLQMSFFTNSGSEANETAIVAAQTYTDNREIVALRHAYSGRTSLTMSVTAHSTWKLGKSFSPDIKHAINPYCYRCPLKLEYPSCGVACAQDIEDVIRTTTSGRNFKSIETIDAKTVKISLCTPDPAFPSKIAFASFAINDADYLESTGGGGELLENCLLYTSTLPTSDLV